MSDPSPTRCVELAGASNRPSLRMQVRAARQARDARLASLCVKDFTGLGGFMGRKGRKRLKISVGCKFVWLVARGGRGSCARADRPLSGKPVRDGEFVGREGNWSA